MLLMKAKATLTNPDVNTPTLSSVSIPPIVDLDIRKQGLTTGATADTLIAAGTGTAAERTFNVLSGAVGTYTKPTVLFDTDLNAQVLAFNGSQNIKTAAISRGGGVPLTLAVLVKTDHVGAGRVITAGVSTSVRKAIQTSTIGFTAIVGTNAAVTTGFKPTGWGVLIIHFNPASSKVIYNNIVHNVTYANLDTSFDVLNLGSAGDGANGFTGRLAYLNVTTGTLSDADLLAMSDEILAKFSLI